MTGSVNEISVQIPIVLTDDEAAQIAEKLLYRAWVEREQYEFQLPIQYIDLDPGDVVQIDMNGHVHIIRITSIDMNLPGVLDVKGIADQASVYTSSVTGGAARYPTQTLTVLPDTIIAIMDIPALRTADVATPGYYVAMYGSNANWTGGLIFKSVDGGTSWGALTTNTIEANIGSVATALGDWTNGYPDYTNSLVVSLPDGGTLSSDTAENVINNGTNAALVGSEIIQFITATLSGTNEYTLTGLLRGRVGTEWAISTHAANETFVELNSAAMLRIDSQNNVFGATQKFKGITSGQVPDDVTIEHDVEFQNLNIRPWSPVELSGTRDLPASGDITLYWQRRDRDIGVFNNTLPMSELEEKYEVHIMNGTVVLRILQTASETAVYTSDQMTTDGVTYTDPLTFRVYQISNVAGRGYVAEETI